MPTKTKYILVVGGAGYIGAHMVLALQEAGYTPIVLDNLSNGHLTAVRDVKIIVGDMANANLLNQLFSQYAFLAVMHFASLIDVKQSVLYPGKYYRNNVFGTLTLIESMVNHGIDKLIFSSSATVFGEGHAQNNFNYDQPFQPHHPYGRSKCMVEEIIKDFANSNNLTYAILRYFNAAGADPLARVGENHEPESHLIPIILQAAQGRRDQVTVYGDNYLTPDGTCIRDYVHVVDLCRAHLLALQALIDGKKTLVYNLGTGKGYSVMNVIDAAMRVTKKKFDIVLGPKRAGDVAVLISKELTARQELGWIPRYSALDMMIEHAWHYLCKSS